jgi:hypothetical protein
MRWHLAGFGLLAVSVTTGCPSEFGKGGRIDRAVHQDALELTRKYCPPEVHQRYCGDGKQDTEECRNQCGN